MIPKAIDAIEAGDIERLISNGVAEGHTIDYKAVLPGGTDDEKREFLADVSSFANSGGGDLVYGVAEAAGIPTGVTGLTVADREAEQLRLDSIIRDGLEPRLPQVTFRWVDGVAGRATVLVIRADRSWLPPHMVKFRNLSRFYGRGASGRFQLDVGQLRAAFTGGLQTLERARSFRTERVTRIVSGDRPMKMFTNNGFACVHVVPHASLEGTVALNLRSLPIHASTLLVPFNPSGGTGSKWNFDGFLTYAGMPDECWCYTQVFRNGIIESVECSFLGMHLDGRRMFPYTQFLDESIRFVERTFALLRQVDIRPPISLFVTLTGAAGYELAPSAVARRGLPTPMFERSVLMFPEAVIEDYGLTAAVQLQPIMDTVWQAAGHERCFLYESP